MRAAPLIVVAVHKEQKIILGILFPVMLLAVFVVITRLKTSCQLKEGHVFEEAMFQKLWNLLLQK